MDNTQITKVAIEILKQSVDVSGLDPKINNRIQEIKKIYQKISVIQKEVSERVGTLQKEIKDLEKQAKIFEKQLLPVLKEVEDHALQAEGIFIELKKGRRSPKVGYEFLADKVNSELLMAAEEAISVAAAFAQSPTVKLSNKTAGVFDAIKSYWNRFITAIKSVKSKLTKSKKTLNELDKLTR